MTELEKAQLAELVERAWRSATNGSGIFQTETISVPSNEITILGLPKGLSVVRSCELTNVVRQWFWSTNELQSTQKKENPDLENEIKKSFGLVEDGYYEIGNFFVFHKSYAEKVAVLAIFLGLIVGLIAGVSLTALFNWIF